MLSIIVPTLGNRLFELERLLNTLKNQTSNLFEVICAIQGNYKEVKSLLNKYNFVIKTLELDKLGLSYARNESLKLVAPESTFVTLSDDDCWYPPNTVEKVHEQGIGFDGCLCFQIFDPVINDYYKNYPQVFDEKLTLRKSLKISSIEIFISSSIISQGIRFDERFGLGTKYPSGEENIFLFDIIRKNYIIRYFPEIIVYHLKPDWKNKEYIFKGKGALFTRLYNKPLAFVMVNIYAFMKKQYSVNIIRDLKNMITEIILFNN